MDYLVCYFYDELLETIWVLEKYRQWVKTFDISDFLRVMEKFDGEFTIKGMFGSRKSKIHYMLMPLHNEGHWLHYIMVAQGLNVHCMTFGWRMDESRLEGGE
jgi:hypothetical protein